MTAYFKSFHKQTTILIYLRFFNIFKIVRNSRTFYLCSHRNSVLVSF